MGKCRDRGDRPPCAVNRGRPHADAGHSTEDTMTMPRTSQTTPYAALLLRVSLGCLFLAHAGLKAIVFTPAGTAQFFEKIGVPGWVALPTILAETLGGIALILGLGTRWVSLVLLPILLGAIVTVHGPNGFFFTQPGGGWEFPAFWMIGLVVQAGLGNGAFAVGARHAADRGHAAAAE
jgi:putative oxidoreductase